MPRFQTIVERCNRFFGSDNVVQAQRSQGLFSSPKTVGAIAVELELATPEQGTYLDSMPKAMGAALKALIATNLQRTQPFGMQFVWFEGAEWEFLITEVGATQSPDSSGGISLMLRSPKL
jgi:hypothetical protein